MGWFPVLQNLAQQLGIPLDFFKITISFIVALLLSPIYRSLTSKTLRNAFSIIVGSILILLMIEEWGLFVFAGIIIPYFLIVSLPQPFLVSAISAAILLIVVHSHRFMYADLLFSVSYLEWRLDCSVYVMLLSTKLTYYGKWFQSQKQKKDVNFWDFLSYNLFFPSLLAGPTFSYETYMTYLNNPQKNTFATLKLAKALRPLAIGCFTGFVVFYFLPIFNTTWVVENEFYLSSSFWTKCLILIPLGFVYRSKYYAAWHIDQAAVNLSGLSEGPKGEYDEVTAVNIKFEIEPNPKIKTEYWNCGIQVWLKNVVYDQLSKKMNGTWALFCTFFVSACWHGFYLTYYFCFAEWAVLNHITKWCYKWSQLLPKKVTDSPIFTVITWLTSCVMMNFVGMVGLILEWNAAVQFYADLYYSPVIIYAVMLVLSLTVKPPSSKKDKAKIVKQG